MHQNISSGCSQEIVIEPQYLSLSAHAHWAKEVHKQEFAM